MWKPARQCSTKSRISSGGCCRSASISTAASPLAYRKPAAMAISLPKLRLSEIALRRRSWAWMALSVANVASVEPSSMKTTSQSRSRLSSTGRRRAISDGSPRSSLSTGTTTESDRRRGSPSGLGLPALCGSGIIGSVKGPHERGTASEPPDAVLAMRAPARQCGACMDRRPLRRRHAGAPRQRAAITPESIRRRWKTRISSRCLQAW